jgi:hypothetical protein
MKDKDQSKRLPLAADLVLRWLLSSLFALLAYLYFVSLSHRSAVARPWSVRVSMKCERIHNACLPARYRLHIRASRTVSQNEHLPARARVVSKFWSHLHTPQARHFFCRALRTASCGCFVDNYRVKNFGFHFKEDIILYFGILTNS